MTRFTPPYLFARPVSPHLAARLEGVTIDIEAVASWVTAIRQEASAVVVELPGGLFTPLDEQRTNAELIRELAAPAVLVAPDRLGVLHDVTACLRAARAEALPIVGIILSTPAVADASTGTNAAELSLRTASNPPVLATLPRGAPELSAPLLDRALAELIAGGHLS